MSIKHRDYRAGRESHLVRKRCVVFISRTKVRYVAFFLASFGLLNRNGTPGCASRTQLTEHLQEIDES